ncbi:MAG: dihydrodipicolinate reductase [Deltaproteobacteria bacterium]|nr:dihydrodipicolinate reductase [Deltaproteobacteria bacterium]
MPHRVVQWTTGNVGRRSLRAIVANPELELVGCYAWSEDKAGCDAGALAGIPDTGVVATRAIEDLIALEPDCISYNPMWPDVDELVRFLDAGINVAATAAFITGHALGEEARQRIEAACQRGQSSIVGSGMNPGFANLLGLVSAGICDRIDCISVLESVDSTGYNSPETELPIGYGRPPTDTALPDMIRQGTAVFGDAVIMMADALHVEVDEIVCESGWAVATKPLDLGYMQIEEGCVAGIEASWQGRIDGRKAIDLKVRWRKGQDLEPDWPLEHGYLVEIEGQPCVKTRLEIRPPPDFQAKSFEDFMQLGMIMNAIPAICKAAPGIRTYADLPLITGAGFVRSSYIPERDSK